MDHFYYHVSDAITRPYPKFKGGLITPSLKLGMSD